MLVHRYNSMTAASFEPVSPIVLIAQKNLGQDPALREKRDPEVAERYKEVANTLHRNRKALLLLFLLDRTVERAKPESSASIETPLRPPAMFRVSVS